MTNITLADVADRAGVSSATVSRVVNDYPHVRPEVRERVQQAIEELGYHPDLIARSLAGQQSGILGLVIPLAIEGLFEDPFYPRLMQGISQACNHHDCILSLLLMNSPEEEVKLFPRISRKKPFDGVILAAVRSGDPLIYNLLANKVAFVLHGRHDNPRVSFVDVDNVAGAFTAVTHLIRLGRSRIATITGPEDSFAAQDRAQGYTQALRSRGYPVDEALVVKGDFTETSGYEGMQRLLPRKPDAVFVASDTMALGALRAMREAGLTAPDDVSVVGFDDMPHAATADPPLTTVRQPIRRAGGIAVETLLDLLENGLEPPRRIVLPTELIIRASCGGAGASTVSF